ncbi:transposase [Dulcicalothrix desertica]|uniref:transposase n=3 Tax=Dulcicalothrix desertica TaxID=32056 RepID=UPI0011992767|nr:transposase [Dulcicalothrix desertica]TWH62656.1 DDE family transposase [Dulcicalothrix desertica PCC 7102]
MLANAQDLVYNLKELMPTVYQKENLEALLGLFLEANGHALPEHSQTKSASALSRFLNINPWSTRDLIRTVRQGALQQVLSESAKGRKPFLQVIIDLTTLEKCGKFKEFEHLISVYNGKRGLHLVVIYLVVGKWRIPWSFRVWRGKGTPSPAQLGLKLVQHLPKSLKLNFNVMILADTAFGSIEFIHGIRKLKYHAITGISVSRKLTDGRVLKHLHQQGQQVRLVGLKFTVTVAWYYLKRSNGRLEKRCVLSTRPLKASTIKWWGKRRWQIEGWFKTAKHRFGLHRFGQGTLKGVYRWLILSFTAYLIAHWTHLLTQSPGIPDWGKAAQNARESFFPQIVVSLLLLHIQRFIHLARSYGFDIQISRCKI